MIDLCNKFYEKKGFNFLNQMGLAETINLLKAKGYSEDFNLLKDSLDKLKLDKLKIDAVFRFDEMSDPSDQSILYAIQSEKTGLKGILVNSYGIYSESKANNIVMRLCVN